MRKIAVGILTLFGFCACEHDNKKSELLDIASEIDRTTRFVDLTLCITSCYESENYNDYIAEALYKSDTVGIRVTLKKEPVEDLVDNQPRNRLVADGIILHSNGRSSDKLLQTMADLYGVEGVEDGMRDEPIRLSYRKLGGTHIDYDEGKCKFRAFLADNGKDPAELFIYFDFEKKLIQLNEKDLEYRRSILTCLMKKSD
jgi:hypothetical protein